jgi:hypothetical protein
MASNVRFLDQVSIGSFQSVSTTSGAATKRFVLAGETLSIAATDQLITYDLFNFGTIIISQGATIPFGTDLVSTDGLLQVQTVLNNEGLILNNGIIIIDSQIV